MIKKAIYGVVQRIPLCTLAYVRDLRQRKNKCAKFWHPETEKKNLDVGDMQEKQNNEHIMHLSEVFTGKRGNGSKMMRKQFCSF